MDYDYESVEGGDSNFGYDIPLGTSSILSVLLGWLIEICSGKISACRWRTLFTLLTEIANRETLAAKEQKLEKEKKELRNLIAEISR